MRLLVTVIATLTLAACGSQQTVSTVPVSGGEQCYQERNKDRSVRLDLIRQLVSEQQYYSALAHLERETFSSPGATFLTAESLRKTGQLDKAYETYDALSGGCLRALGHLGKGKILAVKGKLPQAIEELRIARDMLPTDANIRNDYGFALLANSQYDAARQEFVTAIQLDNNHDTAVRNLVLSLILNGDRQMAWRVAQHHQINVEEFKRMLSRSIQFQEQRVVNVINDPRSGINQPILERKGGAL